MYKPVHFEVEILYETTFTTACGFGANSLVTKDEAQVTCKRCLKALGYAERLRND